MRSAEEGDDGEVKLLNFWASPYGMRAVLALAAKGIPYTTIPQELGAENRSPLLLQSNPIYKKVPVLLHKGKAVCESLIICEYVDEAFPHSAHALLPSDPYLKALARFWADFCDKKIFATFLKPMLVPKEEFESAIEECKSYFTILEDAFTNEGPFFGGSKVGFVDIVMGPLVACLPALQIVTSYEWEFDELPHLQNWLKAFSECPLASCLPDSEKIIEAAKVLRQNRFPQDP